ncbi:DUF6173 family protein [Sulfitobacter sabulilitoris]|uniref:Uncharacterized protein n=1 Tax=Sulfitobacter sabulilitoris TaxID=2562655 RepID=A0A5S3QEC9_9RHOB|nr:DUF6173 family protein [Sulfitobacter sabulilitoris]TMM55512.1 hypothetical protein FDT80_08160 [Sulfitobacter sabulilitoris]
MDDDIRTAAEAHEDDALPRCHEVHADPNTANAGDQPIPRAVKDTPLAKKSPAQWAYERVVLYLRNFEEQLDADQEVAMGFTGGDAGVLRIEGMGYFDPDIVTFYGTDGSGGRTQLVQHVSQLNVMLRALPKPVERETPSRIGFRLAQDLDGDTPAET